MRTIVHSLPMSAEQLSLRVPEGWRESFDEDLLVLSRPDSGTGALQVSLAPHLDDADFKAGDLAQMASYFATEGADAPAGPVRTWDVHTEDGEVLRCGTAGSSRGEWFIQCFVLRRGDKTAFATYVCRTADSPGELELVEQMLRTLQIHENDDDALSHGEPS